MLVKASAPGSLMLLGEYAVLHGKHALVCAVDKRIQVTISPRSDDIIEIISTLGQIKMDRRKLRVEAPFQFVLSALKTFQKQLSSGCTVSIESEFSSTIGFGSSAAVTVATVKALSTWLNLSYTNLDLIRKSRRIIRKVQGLGSGADVAACVLGGMVAYKMQPLQIEKIEFTYPITAVYSGYKTPTVLAVKQVKEAYLQETQLFKQLFQSIGACVLQGIKAARAQDWTSLGRVMNIQQGLMDSLGVNTPLLNQIVNDLRATSDILGAKISGSGMGDCLIGLGSAKPIKYSDAAIQFIPVKMSKLGVQCEKI